MGASELGETRGRLRSIQESRASLRVRLEARWPEIEETVRTRIYSISDPSETRDPEYVEGLRTALGVALDYGLAVIECGEGRTPAVPTALLSQARMAARNGVTLDTVVRRYSAGYSLLSEFVIKEAEDGGLFGDATLQRILRGQAAVLDRLIAAVSEEHGRESNGRASSMDQRRVERVERLLGGEFLDASDLAYDLDIHHLGAIAAGPGAAEALHDLADRLAARILLIRREEGTVWAWLGSRRHIDAADFERLARSTLPPQISLALGEPAHALPGWRFTHRQARAAFPVARRGAQSVVRYADVALLASILQDNLLAASFRELYLTPLAQERGGGEVLRQTLRAYFAAGRNISSAAATLGVSRRTVSNRLRTVEARIGHALRPVASQIEAALCLHDFDDTSAASPNGSRGD